MPARCHLWPTLHDCSRRDQWRLLVRTSQPNRSSHVNWFPPNLRSGHVQQASTETRPKRVTLRRSFAMNSKFTPKVNHKVTLTPEWLLAIQFDIVSTGKTFGHKLVSAKCQVRVRPSRLRPDPTQTDIVPTISGDALLGTKRRKK